MANILNDADWNISHTSEALSTLDFDYRVQEITPKDGDPNAPKIRWQRATRLGCQWVYGKRWQTQESVPQEVSDRMMMMLLYFRRSTM